MWFWWERQKERDHYEDLFVGGRIILRWISEKLNGVLWTEVAQDRERRRALVNMIMNLRVP
jgi:hypothetical protein